MASFFKQLSDDMEKVAQVVEEGAKFMMGGAAEMGGGQGSDGAADPTAGGEDFHVGDADEDGIFDDIDGMEDGFHSPLMGMAENVMSDIMSTQVRFSGGSGVVANEQKRRALAACSCLQAARHEWTALQSARCFDRCR